MKDNCKRNKDDFDKQLRLLDEAFKNKLNIKDKVNWKMDNATAARNGMYRNLSDYLTSFHLKTGDKLLELDSKLEKYKAEIDKISVFRLALDRQSE